MAWDLALDPETGDFVFGPARDLIGVTGPELDQQRISIRVKIPRGSFTYDDDGTLGSLLHTIPRHPSEIQLHEAQSYVLEALDGMDGVSVDEVQVSVNENGQVEALVSYHQTTGIDATEDDFTEDQDVPAFDARVTID